VKLDSTITCPACGFQSIETMPTDACQISYHCRRCGESLRPKSGDCCVFCSYGDVACPPIQLERETGGGLPIPPTTTDTTR
jgi:hypothetical protein